jgi:drug/metabolite transporter (DMT)-like permease
MVKAFSVGATGVVAPIANSYAVLTALISVIFLDSVLTLTGALAIVVIIGGIALLTYKKDPNHNKRDFERSVRYSLLALLLFGVGFALFDVASTQEWYQNNLLFQLVGIFVASTLFVIATKAKSIDVIKGTVKTPLLYVGSIIGGMGAVGLFLAIAQADNVAIPAAVGAAAPLMTAFLAYKFDGEHLTGLQRFASVIIVLGIIMLSI